MKKKMLTGILAVSMLGVALTGCGNKEVTKTDETQAVIAESTQAALEKDLEPATEKTTEATTEAVKADFLAENGLKITPNGSMTIPVAKWGSDELTDLAITTSVTTVASSEEGYSDTTFTVTADKNLDSSGVSYNISAFDRYTGTSYESKPESLSANNGSTHDEVVVVDVDGKQYDCAFDVEQKGYTVTTTVHHPSNYDGVVFILGSMTATQNTAYYAVDSSKTFTIADYSDVFIDGQYFFTATDK